MFKKCVLSFVLWNDRPEICISSRAEFRINVQNVSIFFTDAEVKFKTTSLTQNNESSQYTHHIVCTNRLPLNSFSVSTGFLECRIDYRFSTRSELMT